ncbi:MAG: serine hydrolase domain-containing protein, partial [Bacteroidota bacterium]
DLDAPINDYLDFDVVHPDFPGSVVTSRMLLAHTSGIADGPSMDGQYYFGSDSPLALADFAEGYFTPGGTYYSAEDNWNGNAPGERHAYSNMGSALIGVVVEAVSGMDFNDYCKQNIFGPLGMSATAWRLDEITGPKVLPYEVDGGDYTTPGHYTFTDYPNGGLRTTAADFHRFAAAFVGGGMSNGAQLLEAGTVNQMLQAGFPDVDSEAGLHTFFMDKREELWGHDGAEQGVSTYVAFHPTNGVGVILLTNMSDVKLEKLAVRAYVLGTEL